jgi:hypothetical protein
LESTIKRKPWSKVDETRLSDIVRLIGAKHWTMVASYILGRGPKQCRERWINHLDSDVLKESWSAVEDSIVLGMQHIYGNCWAGIALALRGRTCNQESLEDCRLFEKRKSVGA